MKTTIPIRVSEANHKRLAYLKRHELNAVVSGWARTFASTQLLDARELLDTRKLSHIIYVETFDAGTAEALVDFGAEIVERNCVDARVNYETEICKRWAHDYGRRLGVEVALEVVCPVGRIDAVFTSPLYNCIIEAKKAPAWKHALGQLLAYAVYYRESDRALLLIGTMADSERRKIDDVCKFYGVRTFWTD